MKKKSGGGWIVLLVIFAVLYFTCFRDCTYEDVQSNALTQSVMSCIGQGGHTSYKGFDGGTSRGAGGGGR